MKNNNLNNFNLDELLDEIKQKKKSPSGRQINDNIDNNKSKSNLSSTINLDRTVNDLSPYDSDTHKNNYLDKESTDYNNGDDISDAYTNKDKNFKLDIDFNDSLEYPLDYLNINDDESGQDLTQNRKCDIENNDLHNKENRYSNIDLITILNNNKKYLLIKTAILALCFLFSTSLICFQKNFSNISTETILIINLFMITVTVVSFHDVFIEGLLSFFKNKLTDFGLISLSLMVCIVQSSAAIISPSTTLGISGILYTPAVMIILFSYVLGKWKMLKLIKLNSKFIMSNCDKYSVVSQSDHSGSYCLSYIKEFEIDSLNTNSNHKNRIDSFYKIIALISISLSVIISIIHYIISKDMYLTICTLSACLIVSTPLSHILGNKLIINKLAKKLYSSGAVIAGEKAINTITDCDSIILDTCDLFNADNIQLVKMKIFDHNQVDTAIIDAASVLHKSDSLFANIFLKIIRNKTDLIKEVTHISINDNLGFNATIENRNIILGSGKLLAKNHIPIPTKYSEEHWIQNNPNLKMIYLAIDGYLVALFLMQLNPLSKIVKYINNLQRQNIGLIFKSKDPLVSVNTVSSVYNIDNDLTNNISTKDPTTNKNFVGISYTGSMSTFVSSIASSITARNLILFTTVIGIISILLGLTLISVFVSLNAIKNLSLINLVIFQISWFTLGAILHSWRKV